MIDKKECCGCYACFSACPQKCIIMKPDNEGFFYPNIDQLNCVKCNKCKAVCPLTKSKRALSSNCEVYACKSKDINIRLNSSSGGIFSLLAEETLIKKGVVIGACYDENFNVIHQSCDSITEYKRFCGSKYCQSNIGNLLSETKMYLENKRQVLFSGTPCQIAGLKYFLGKDYENLLCVDVVCHGVPSPMVFKRYLHEKYEYEKIDQIFFRNKKSGLKKSCMTACYKNGIEVSEQNIENLYMKGFYNDLTTRPSCYECKHKYPYCLGDITLGDFWGVEEFHPDFYDDLGVSLVIVNTKKGRQSFMDIEDKIDSILANIDQATVFNINVNKCALPNKRRGDFFKLLESVSIEDALSVCLKKRLYEKLLKKIDKYRWHLAYIFKRILVKVYVAHKHKHDLPSV